MGENTPCMIIDGTYIVNNYSNEYVIINKYFMNT